MTYDYSKVMKELSSVYMKLMLACHNYLSDPRHGCYMTANLKHAYFIIEVHFEDRKFFAFTIFGLGQLQPIRMQQRFMTALFIMSELKCRVLEEISENIENSKKSSFL